VSGFLKMFSASYFCSFEWTILPSSLYVLWLVVENPGTWKIIFSPFPKTSFFFFFNHWRL
jgi:hypothetical protein